MSSSRDNIGGRHLAHRNDLTHARKSLPQLDTVLVVDDVVTDANRIKATLAVIFEHDLDVRIARTLNAAIDCVLEKCPGVILLDDYLKPADSALTSIPMLRRAGYEGDIIVVSSMLDRHRHRELIALGAADVIHKDDMNSVRILETLNRTLQRLAEAG